VDICLLTHNHHHFIISAPLCADAFKVLWRTVRQMLNHPPNAKSSAKCQIADDHPQPNETAHEYDQYERAFRLIFEHNLILQALASHQRASNNGLPVATPPN
jgi:hypothetical protein